MSPRSSQAPRAGQAGFAQALLDPSAPPPAGVRAPGGGPVGKRFDVYRNNVVVSLAEALRAGFPTVEALVGEDFFKAMAVEHARACPPQSPLMIFYGADFAGWIEGFPPAASLPYLGDVARIDYARRRAYHAADAEPMAPDAVGGAFAAIAVEAQGAARLTLHPSVEPLSFDTPAVSIWRRARGEAEDPNAGALANRPEEAFAVRVGSDVVLADLPPGGATCVAALKDGASLAGAAAAAARELGAAGRPTDFDFAATLGALIAASAVCAVRPG